MHLHILKFSFVSLAALLLTFSMTVKVNAETAYTLTASDQKYEVEADVFEQWRNPQKKNQVIYYLAPQTNLDHFVLEQLGAL
jgi:hypothetical protein